MQGIVLKEGAPWCNRHSMGHKVFDNRSVCIGCVEEMAEENEIRGHKLLEETRNILSVADLKKLNDYLQMSSLDLGRRQPFCFVRLLATEALLSNTSVGGIMRKIRKERSISEILPSTFV